MEQQAEGEDSTSVGFLGPKPAQLYQTLPLPPDSKYIRLLDLDSSSDPTHTFLSGTLRVVSLDDCSSFAALSYVCGKYTSPAHTIICNGCSHEITSNCHGALMSLRQLYSPLTIWVDSICIDQKNITEKSEQIQLMEYIYARATAVLIWLGPGSAESEQVMETLSQASRMCFPWTETPWVSEKLAKRPDSTAKLERVRKIFNAAYGNFRGRLRLLQKLLFYSFYSLDLESLLSKEWLNRAWTFQELILSTNPIIIEGTTSIEWTTLHRGLYYYRRLNLYGAEILSESFNNSRPPVLPFLYSASHDEWDSLNRLWMNISRPNHSGPAISRNFCDNSGWSIAGYERLHMPKFQMKFFLAIWTLIHAISSPCVNGLIVVYAWLSSCTHRFPRQHTLFPSESMRKSLILERIIVGFIMSCCIIFGIPTTAAIRGGEVEQSFDLITLIHALRTRITTEPKDTVFALYGILRHLGVYMPKPDYEKSLGQIHHELYLALLRHRPSCINLLSDAGSESIGGVTPSWVPNFSSAGKRSFLPSDYIYRANRQADVYWVREWKETTKTTFVLSENKLIVRGRWAGFVQFSSGSFPKFDSDVESQDPQALIDQLLFPAWVLLRWWPLVLSRDGSSTLGRSEKELILDTIFIPETCPTQPILRDLEAMRPRRRDQPPEKLPLSRLHIADLFHERAELYEKSKTHAAATTGAGHEPEPASMDRKDFSNWDDDDLYSSFISIQALLAKSIVLRKEVLRICRHFDGRRGIFFSQKAGIGTGPPTVRYGDQIANIAGVEVPLVLREVGRGGSGLYQVVGPAYMDGMKHWRLGHDYDLQSLPEIVLV